MRKLVFLFLLLSSDAMADKKIKNFVNISGEITAVTKKYVENTLDGVQPGSTVYVKIDSVGGLVDQAAEVSAILKSYKTICFTENAQSAAFYIYQDSCTVRAATYNARLMIHHVSLLAPPSKLPIAYRADEFFSKALETYVIDKFMLMVVASRLKLKDYQLNLMIDKTINRTLYLNPMDDDVSSVDVLSEGIKELHGIYGD